MIKVFVNRVQQKPEVFIKMGKNIKINFKCRNRDDLTKQLDQIKNLKINSLKIVICSTAFITAEKLLKKISNSLDINYDYIINYIKPRIANYTITNNTIKNLSPVTLTDEQINIIKNKLLF